MRVRGLAFRVEVCLGLRALGLQRVSTLGLRLLGFGAPGGQTCHNKDQNSRRIFKVVDTDGYCMRTGFNAFP